MMKRLWLCAAAALAAVSCIPVDDFGTYWDKGVVDPALEGSWKRLDSPGAPPLYTPFCTEGWRLARTGSAYSLYRLNEVSDPFTVRTLRVDGRKLLMERGPRGDGLLTSYEIHNRILSSFGFRNDTGLEFLRAKHPGAKNIGENVGAGQFVVIKTFDDEVFRILSELANSPNCCDLMCKYQKASN